MFWSKNKRNRLSPANPSFLYKSGVRGGTCFPGVVLVPGPEVIEFSLMFKSVEQGALCTILKQFINIEITKNWQTFKFCLIHSDQTT